MRVLTIKPEPLSNDHREQVISNISECEQDFFNHVDDDLVPTDIGNRSEVIDDGQCPCVFDGSGDSKSERDIYKMKKSAVHRKLMMNKSPVHQTIVMKNAKISPTEDCTITPISLLLIAAKIYRRFYGKPMSINLIHRRC